MPHYWIMNYNYNEAWDKKFQELAEQHAFVPVGEVDNVFGAGTKTYRVFLHDCEVWVANYPYAFFVFMGRKSNGRRLEGQTCRPSRYTIDKYYKKLVTDLAKYNCTHA